MARRSNHYEAAFEEYLRARRVPYVAVDETRRSILGEGSIKNLDFLVSPGEGCRSWLVDVKGRLFPAGRQKRYWNNWSTRDDLLSLSRWQRLFGEQFLGLLVFAYQIAGDRAPLPAEQLFTHRGRWYAFVGMRLDYYASWARQISPRWDTVALPAARFRQLARPCEAFFLEGPTAEVASGLGAPKSRLR